MKPRLLSLLAVLPLVTACGIYSFSGTSIQADVRTITIPYVEYTALRVNPSLSANLTQALQEKYRKLTSLEQVDVDGDLEVVCEITGYEVAATAVTADEVAAQNRLTVTVHCTFTNRKYPEEDSTLSLDAVESNLCQTIIETLCEDIFNATVAQW